MRTPSSAGSHTALRGLAVASYTAVGIGSKGDAGISTVKLFSADTVSRRTRAEVSLGVISKPSSNISVATVYAFGSLTE